MTIIVDYATFRGEAWGRQHTCNVSNAHVADYKNGAMNASDPNPENNIEAFLRNIPSQIAEARRQLFCNNINVIEFIQRRLEDNLFVVNILHQRALERIDDRQIQTDLGILVSELQSLCSSYDALWIRNEDLVNPLSITCLLEDVVQRGRRRYSLPQNALTSLHTIHRRWSQVAAEIGVSYRTLLRRRHEYSLPVSNTSGPRNTFTEISRIDLCNVVREVLQLLPNAGETFVLGALRQRNIHIQRWKVRDAICSVDPLGRAMRRSVAILRRVYNVPCPNALW